MGDSQSPLDGKFKRTGGAHLRNRDQITTIPASPGDRT
jgi:hypothetical protein